MFKDKHLCVYFLEVSLYARFFEVQQLFYSYFECQTVNVKKIGKR